MCSYSSDTKNGGDVFKPAEFFSQRPEFYLAPLLVKLNGIWDKRLVHTFSGLCQSIIRLRSRSTGLLISEPGGNLLSFDKAPCNQQVKVRRKWQLGMHKKWQQECTAGVNI